MAVQIGTVRILRAEYTHLVATGIVVTSNAACGQTTIAHEQIVVAVNILDVRSLT